MIVILHSPHDEKSRAFVEANGSYPVVDWFEPESFPRMALETGGVVRVSSFPAVMDTSTRRVASSPPSMEEAMAMLAGTDESSIRETRKRQVDEKTAAMVERGFFWVARGRALHFRLGAEDIAWYNAMYCNRDALKYPFEIEGVGYDMGEVFISLDAAEVEDFYQKMFSHIQSLKESGCRLKSAINIMTYNELLEFVDGRTLG